MSSIKVSIIIPVYNGTQSIIECMNTCRTQTLGEIEIICIDDGSTDNSAEIIQKLIHEDARIHLIQQDNQGPGPARNEGIKVAAGEYIAFMDADDKYPSVNTLEHMYYVAKNYEALICGGSFFSDNGKFRKYKFDGTFAGNTFNKEGWIEFRTYQYDYAFYRFIYSRKFLTDNNIYFPKYLRYEDPPFMVKAFMAAGKFYALPDITYNHVIYQHFSWTLDKVYDLLSGIEDNLIVSIQNEYKQLFMLNYNRICSDFCNTIVNVALKEDSKGIIVRKLFEIQNLVNAHPQMNDGYFTDDTFSCSVPLDRLITEISLRSFQSAELKKKADSAKKDAEAAKNEAALGKKDVDIVRKEIEIAKRDTEIARKDTEIANRDADLARKEAVAARKEIELTRSEATESRKEADSAKAEADQARRDAVAARKETEIARKEAAESRKEALAAKAEADQARRDAATARKETEAARNEAAESRTEADSAKADADQARRDAATARNETEVARSEAAKSKKEADIAKADAGQARQEAAAARKETADAKISAVSAWDDAHTAKEGADLAREEVKSAKKDAETAWKEIDRLNALLQSVKHSYSYRIGRTVTYIPRKIRSALKKKNSGKS